MLELELESSINFRLRLSGIGTQKKPQRQCFPCEKCHKVYSNISTLYRHLKLECGISPQFHCPYCNFSSKRKHNLKYHVTHKHRTA
ncbi:unnamed protein product [Xylocopa violacea]|uniref:C2H2-type domain-containing protein n=1 Tax=Xylocopa violacea TaxID=135666 RepID=A0ABP1NFY8_XYLVO